MVYDAEPYLLRFTKKETYVIRLPILKDKTSGDILVQAMICIQNRYEGDIF
jgi:hypothetical protein